MVKIKIDYVVFKSTIWEPKIHKNHDEESKYQASTMVKTDIN